MALRDDEIEARESEEAKEATGLYTTNSSVDVVDMKQATVGSSPSEPTEAAKESRGGIGVITNLFFGSCGVMDQGDGEARGAGAYVFDQCSPALVLDSSKSKTTDAGNENEPARSSTPEDKNGFCSTFGTPDRAAGPPLATEQDSSWLPPSSSASTKSRLPPSTTLGATNELHRIAKVGDWSTLRACLTNVTDHEKTVIAAGQVDEKGRTPLMLACTHGSKFPADVARLLLVANNKSASVYVLQRNGGKQYCLHVAAITGCNIEVLRILHGACPKAACVMDGNGNMPLHLAVNNGRYRSIAGQLAAADDFASTIGNTESVLNDSTENPVAIVNSQSLVTVPVTAPARDSDTESGCGTSIATNSLQCGLIGNGDILVDVCEFLISANTSALQHRNRRGETPLLLAIFRRSPSDVISLLLVRGGTESIKIADDFGSYPIHFCDRSPSLSLVRDMAGLYPEAIMSKNRLGNTPLYCAMADSCDITALRILLECCTKPRETVESKNESNVNIIKFGWDDLTTQNVVAAEDQDEEDERLEECKTLLLTASGPEDISGKYLGNWWAKATLLLQAAYHDTIMPTQDDLLNGRKWKPVHAVAGTECPISMVKFVLQIYADGAGDVDENDNTPLHIATSRPDIIGIEAIKLLLDAHPGSTMIQNKDGYSPLHVACLYKAPLEILELLLHSSPDATCLRNKEGQSPLFIAISVGSSVDVLRALLEAKPRSVHIRDDNGISSIALAWNMLLSGKVFGERGKNKRSEAQRSSANIASLAVISRSSSLKGDIRSWMSKVDLLLRASFHSTVEDPLPKGRQWRAVHAACSGGTVPHGVLSFALQILPSEVDVMNESRNYPLHIAAAAPPHVANCPPQLGSGESIELLLKANTNLARKPDRKGRLPLHLALKSGKTWKNGVESIFNAFPEASQMRDPESLLYPFMMAACANDDQRKGDECSPSDDLVVKGDSQDEPDNKHESVDLAVVNTIFTLLRDAPKFISSLKSNAEMAFLWRSRNELIAETERMKEKIAGLESELHKRMTPNELREIEDEKKRDISRMQEEERRGRANDLELTMREMTKTLSQVASSMMSLKDRGL